MTPVEHDDAVFGIHVFRDSYGSATNKINRQRGKHITGVKFFRHDFAYPNQMFGRESTEATLHFVRIGAEFASLGAPIAEIVISP
ncbi:MAG: hypothetical protein HQ514_17610 [Rhodospirillales bacterium]|nr:hypothetical protein [Rhodospirillales bacterium]